MDFEIDLSLYLVYLFICVLCGHVFFENCDLVLCWAVFGLLEIRIFCLMGGSFWGFSFEYGRGYLLSF